MRQRFQKVRADTLDEAYNLVRKKYGAEAIVISTSQVSKGGLLGLLGQKQVEVTASIPESALSLPQRKATAVERKYAEHGNPPKDPETNETVHYFEKVVRDAQARMNRPESRPGGAPGAFSGTSPVVPFPAPKQDFAAGDERVRRELQEMREMIQVLYSESPGAGLPAEFAPHYRTLIEQGVSRKVSAALIGAVVKNSDLAIIRDPRVFVERLQFEIRKAVTVTGGIALQGGGCRIIAVCGPTGVGKTTNLAKIAAEFAVRERARVALLTTDTYRVAAAEQLRVYANIIGVPIRVTNDVKDVAPMLKEFDDYDLVLVDTAGGSQFNLEQLSELQGMLHAIKPHETILVLGANTPLEDLRNIVNSFMALHPTSAMFTKLDETRRYGALFSVAMERGLPLSYMSVGQNVPDDIRVATPELVANLLMEGRKNHG